MKLLRTICFIIIFLFLENLLAKTTIVYNNSIENTTDIRKLYNYEVLKLLLEKTIIKYGNYELIPAPIMNKKRAILTVKANKIKNFILKISVTKDLLNDLAYSNFPVDLGITGYRICFISPDAKEKINNINRLEELKNLEIAQGIGWLDNEILEYNGFTVKEIDNYKGILNMTVYNRVDLFPRGANEILGDYERFKNIKGLSFDKTFSLYYPLPRFFFAHKSNEELIKRIEEGLKIAYYDGSLELIFNKYYKKSMEFINLKKRTIYRLENPFLKGIDKSYEKYIYDTKELK